ncbi:hypothetical protein ACLIBH_13120, partial [Virgibacillus sp. W0430]|uniref:hypothetical protein n=1 Tax=Virgibacillus sp. W0430 TaxID=3391580 RepID=UPI003F467CF8
RKSKWWETENNYIKEVVTIRLNKLINSRKEFIVLLDTFKSLMASISNHTTIKNKSDVLDDLIKFDKLYNNLLENNYYNDFLSFFIRIHVQYLANELQRLNEENDVLKKGKEIVPIFTSFMKHCQQGDIELENVMSRIYENELLAKGKK